MISREIIYAMLEAGVRFAPTTAGLTRSDVPGWQDTPCTQALVKLWLDQGYSLVVVAHRGAGFVIDIDDPDAVIEKGFDPKWLSGYFAVDTPSGGVHVYGLSNADTDALPNLVVVHAEKGNRESKKILELKTAKGSTAAPTAERKGQKNKCDGTYVPRRQFSPLGTKTGLPTTVLDWLKEHAESTEVVDSKPIEWEFHQDFDESEFLENEGCTEQESGYVDGAYHIAVETCPHCDRPSGNSTLRAAKVKFIFGGASYGFKCHMCGVESREKHEELMQAKNENYSGWKQPIYITDDPEVVAEMLDKLAVESVPVAVREPEREIDDEAFMPVKPVEKFKGKVVVPGTAPEPSAEPVAAPDPEPIPLLKYPELAFPYEALADGMLKKLVFVEWSSRRTIVSGCRFQVGMLGRIFARRVSYLRSHFFNGLPSLALRLVWKASAATLDAAIFISSVTTSP